MNAPVSNDGDAKSSPSHNIPYSLPGIICYLQHEWTKMEAERQSWAVQRAEYKAKISMLNGEVMGLQNLKTVLIRRIKMLEHALKMERFKGSGLQPADAAGSAAVANNNNEQGRERVKDSDVQLFTPLPSSCVIKRGKQLMNKFLEEIGQIDNLVDLRSERARFSIVEKYRQQFLVSDQMLRTTESNPYRMSVQDYERAMNENEQQQPQQQEDSTPAAVLQQFEFLENAEFGEEEGTSDWVNKCNENMNENASTSWPSYDPPETAVATENFKPAAVNALPDRIPCVQNGNSNDDEDEARYVDEQIAIMSRSEDTAASALPPPPSSTSTKKTVAEYQERQVEELSTLHGHMDVVRCLVIHKSAPLLITGSDDHTAKLWDISDALNKGGPAIDLCNPIHTIRKHTACVSAVGIGPKQNWFFTADASGKVYLWSIISLNPEDWREHDCLIDNLAEISGYNDSVACIETVPSMDILLASFSNHSLQMWFVDKCDPGNVVPANSVDTEALGTAVRFIPLPNDRDALVAFNRGSIVTWNLVKQDIVPLVGTDEAIKNAPQLTDMTCSSEQSRDFVVASYDDGYLRWFDLKTGALFRSMMVHQSVITAVYAVSTSLLTTAHDGILRVWLLDDSSGDFICKNEQLIHRRKADEAVVSLACRMPLIASGGADSLCKLFRLTNISFDAGW